MKPRGPKPKPLEERRRNRIQVNLNDPEYIGLEELAEEDGESVPNYSRKVLARHVAAKRRKRGVK